MSKKIPDNKNIFFYDGDCLFCRSLAIKLNDLNQNPKLIFLSFRDFDEDSLLKFNSELNEEILEGEVQLVYENKRYPGFFAVRKIMPSLQYYWILTPFLYLPLIPLIGMYYMVFLKKKRNDY